MPASRPSPIVKPVMVASASVKGLTLSTVFIRLGTQVLIGCRTMRPSPPFSRTSFNKTSMPSMAFWLFQLSRSWWWTLT